MVLVILGNVVRTSHKVHKQPAGWREQSRVSIAQIRVNRPPEID